MTKYTDYEKKKIEKFTWVLNCNCSPNCLGNYNVLFRILLKLGIQNTRTVDFPSLFFKYYTKSKIVLNTEDNNLEILRNLIIKKY